MKLVTDMPALRCTRNTQVGSLKGSQPYKSKTQGEVRAGDRSENHDCEQITPQQCIE